MIPALNRVLRHGLLGGTDYRDLGIGRSVINEQQMVHIRQGNNKLNEGADHLDFFESNRLHLHLLVAINTRYALFGTVRLPPQS